MHKDLSLISRPVCNKTPTTIYPQKQSWMAWGASWYLRRFPVQRGRGLVNRLLGRFLQVRVFDGVKIRLVNPLEFHQRLLLFQEPFEPEVTNLLSTVLRQGMVFFDVGANLGYYTLLASARVGCSGQVHAFEPAPEPFRHLQLNIGINQATNVILNNVALAESPGEKDLFLSHGWNKGTHSFGKILGQTTSIRVPSVPLDDYTTRTNVSRLDVMKVDVEGAELLVFRGGLKTLSSLPPSLILFEACEPYAQALGTSTPAVKQFLHHHGYELFRLDPAPQPIRASLSAKEAYTNLVAIQSQADDWYYETLQACCSARQL